ncbi:putative cation efflux protein [Helianthus annuus]|uniref:Cation efflux protein n=1 Tax=Helianthus annuus TaxID=4232 RepID=A0A251S7U3_HELAN|nr:probable zinc transporter protein DDB_G0291141 [Helianthus annuus]KAF5763842.1 putative cation efflux protein [Helianthus annuus]KAJ0472456.1 putative cation efflux protein [Helianthus annuus]KAJ0648057.1 putative cation efflux protein [Helianthus annuus]KAJ0843962.1 putative cation efflux protein [Helianthus annuus]
MASDHHHHHHQHRPHRLSLPPRTTIQTTPITPSRHYPPFTPTPTPSKHRHRLPPFSATKTKRFTPSSLFLLLFSLRSLYSLLPFLQSSPSSFSIFPFSFLVSLLSFILSFTFSLFKNTLNSKSIFTIHHSITKHQQRILFAKSILLAIVFLIRFQALRYCGTAAMILAETSGHLVAGKFRNSGSDKVRGFFFMFTGLLLLSISWDRIECFPFSFVNLGEFGFSSFLVANREKCVRVWAMVLPFVSGFLSAYEQGSMNWGGIRELGRKEVGLISLFYTTVVLFVPAAVSMLVFEAEGDSVSIGGLGWPLVNTVVFGVLLSESYVDEKVSRLKDFRKEFVVTFVCTVVLELVYYPELSLWGLLICGMLLWVGVMELDPVRVDSLELGLEVPDTFLVSVMKSVRHVLSERKSRKIALFLLINTAYMVVEFVAGFMNNSLGLISDACHMLFDCAALAIGLYASYIARLPANSRYNYGRGRFEVLSGYVNAVFLVLVGALIVLESLERILEPQEISTSSLLMVSIGGLAVNMVGLIFFHDEHHHAHGGAASCSHSHSHNHAGHDHKIDTKHHDHHDHHHVHHDHEHHHDCEHDHNHGHVHNDHEHDHNHDHEHHHNHDHDHAHHDHDHDHDHEQKHHHHHIDHNMEGIFLHVLADTLGSVGVVISTLLIQYKGWLIADPACSLFISILIVSSVIPLLKNSAEILLQRVPRDQEHELKAAVSSIMKIKGICGIQNFHIWSLTNNDVVGTLHLYISTETDKVSTKKQVSDILHDAGIKDLTLQVEYVK